MKVLGRWATVGFAVLAVFLGGMAVVITWYLWFTMLPATKFPASVGTSYAVTAFASTPVVVATLMLAGRRSGSNVLAYLGLDVPRWRHIAIAVAGLAVWMVFVTALGFVLGRKTQPRMLENLLSARADGTLIWLTLAIVVAAPIQEEVLFRGFMFRGFVHAPRDASPSIVLISLIWSLLHFQYDWIGIAEIFVFGLLLGLVRWRTGSTTLTILLHMVANLTIWTRLWLWIETELMVG